MRQKRSR